MTKRLTKIEQEIKKYLALEEKHDKLATSAHTFANLARRRRIIKCRKCNHKHMIGEIHLFANIQSCAGSGWDQYDWYTEGYYFKCKKCEFWNNLYFDRITHEQRQKGLRDYEDRFMDLYRSAFLDITEERDLSSRLYRERKDDVMCYRVDMREFNVI